MAKEHLVTGGFGNGSLVADKKALVVKGFDFREIKKPPTGDGGLIKHRLHKVHRVHSY